MERKFRHSDHIQTKKMWYENIDHPCYRHNIRYQCRWIECNWRRPAHYMRDWGIVKVAKEEWGRIASDENMILEIRDNVTCFTPLIAEAIRVEVVSFMVYGGRDCVIFGRVECVDRAETLDWRGKGWLKEASILFAVAVGRVGRIVEQLFRTF